MATASARRAARSASTTSSTRTHWTRTRSCSRALPRSGSRCSGAGGRSPTRSTASGRNRSSAACSRSLAPRRRCWCSIYGALRDPDRRDPQARRDRHGRHVHRRVVRRPAGDPRRSVPVGGDPDTAPRALDWLHRNGGQNVVLVAHSGGTIVSFATLLRYDHTKLDVAKLVTPRRGDQARLGAREGVRRLGARQHHPRRRQAQASEPAMGRRVGVVRPRTIRQLAGIPDEAPLLPVERLSDRPNPTTMEVESRPSRTSCISAWTMAATG